MKSRSMIMAATAMLLGPALPAAKAPKLPRDAPYCAPPGTRQLFVAASGEPFRAPAGRPYPVAEWFAGADRNRDGAIDRAEFVADARRFFATLDRDHDGRLTPEEVAVYEHEVAPEIALYASRPQPGDGPAERARGSSVFGGEATSGYGGPMGAGRYAWLNIPEPVVAADADIDRVVSEAEFLAAAGRRFDTLDTAGAGVLRLAALPRTPAQIAIEGPCRPRPAPKREDRERERDRLPEREPPR